MSVRIVKWWLSRYWRHFLTAVVIAASSRTYVDALSNLEQKGMLKKAIRWLCWDKIALMPIPEASVSTKKGREKSDKLRAGA